MSTRASVSASWTRSPLFVWTTNAKIEIYICAAKIDIDISRVPDDSKVPKTAIRAVIAILVTMALLTIYANVQRLRRDKLETVIVTPIVTPSPSPAAP